MLKRRQISPHNKLGLSLLDTIRREGPIPFRQWMGSALYDFSDGYYSSKRERWGRGGDYRTSPRASPLFASTIARFAATFFESMGRPRRFQFIEWGGGDGRFAKQFRETVATRFPGMFEALEYVLIERSQGSREAARVLQEGATEGVVYLENPESITLAEVPSVLFSNELVDAFPVHRVRLRDGRLEELFVTVDEDGVFQWVAQAPSSPELSIFLKNLGVELEEGQIAEINLEAGNWLRQIAETIKAEFIVTVDYGSEARKLYDFGVRPAGSLRAFRKHMLIDDLLDAPGEQDLTSNVCWTELIRVGRMLGFQEDPLDRLDQFLMRNGILSELDAFIKHNGEAEIAEVAVGAREMILPGGMASHFDVLTQRKVS